jgi:hypothetical protein
LTSIRRVHRPETERIAAVEPELGDRLAAEAVEAPGTEADAEGSIDRRVLGQAVAQRGARLQLAEGFASARDQIVHVRARRVDGRTAAEEERRRLGGHLVLHFAFLAVVSRLHRELEVCGEVDRELAEQRVHLRIEFVPEQEVGRIRTRGRYERLSTKPSPRSAP